MTDITAHHQALSECLASTLAASQAFTPLLNEEYQYLSGADLHALVELNQTKESATLALLDASTKFLDRLQQLNLEPDTASITDWAYSLPAADGSKLLNQWNRLKTSLDKNDRQHAVNRQLLSALEQRNAAQLNLLKNLLGQTDTYSSQGQHRSQSPSGWVDQV